MTPMESPAHTNREYSPTLEVRPLEVPPNATITIPGSKSITNRALILAALADGISVLDGALFSEDTAVMCDALRKLGFDVIERSDREQIVVNGLGGRIPAEDATLFLANSGTSIRFLTALVSLGSGLYVLDGVERMRERPQADLLDALGQLGVRACSLYDNGCPPLTVMASGRIAGGHVTVGADASSQFLSALLMVAPYAMNDLAIRVSGTLRPSYVEITRRMMLDWGADVTLDADGAFHVTSDHRYSPRMPYRVEPDASGASYFFAAAAVTGGTITVPGLNANSLQGDTRFSLNVLAQMGCDVTADERGITVTGAPNGALRGIDIDMSEISDTSLTLAAIAPFATSPTTIRGVAHSRLQECDRVSAACTELTRLGVRVEERPDGLTIYPTQKITPATVRTYRDHRVAMSFAITGLRAPGVTIDDPGCVAKTFPDFWDRLELLRR